MMKKTLGKITALLCLMLLSGFQWNAAAQTPAGKDGSEKRNAVANGTVIDGNGLPLEGVAVVETGTSNGTLTDSEGKFRLRPGSDEATLQFSCLGWVSVEIPASDRKALARVVMKEENLMIDGTVVIGYGTIRRGTLANSVASVRSDELVQGSVLSPLQMLQGKVAGLSVAVPSGDPNGEDPQMMLRGVSTLMADQSPLIVIDGVVSGSLDNVTPDDILSVDVLKDGAAAAIYGTQGNNGVILITTKRDTGEASTILYHGYMALDNISNKIRLFSSSEYRNLEEITGGEFIPLNNGADTDWYAQVFRPAVSHYHNLSFNGGKPGGRYYANIAYSSLQGIIRGSDRDKLNFSVGTNHSFFKGKLRVRANLSNAWTKGHKVAEKEAYIGALTANPTYPIYNEATGAYSIFANVSNPAKAINEYREDINRNEVSGTGRIVYAPLKSLTFNAVGGMKLLYNFNGTYATGRYDESRSSGQAWRNTVMRLTYDLQAFAQYSERFGRHDITAVAGYSWFSHDSQTFKGYNYDFPTDKFEYNNMGLGLALKEGNATMSSERSMNSLMSFFSRVNYGYDDRYLLALSLRGDGSSKFGPNHRWGAFWSVSGAWRISGERFMRGAKDWLDELKLRLSYGVTGVEPSSPYLSRMTFEYSDPVYMDDKYVWTISPSAVANPDLKWEEKHEGNIGLDFSMFGARFSGTLDLYMRNTKDLLYSYSVPMPPNLASTIYANVGSISNRGVELMLSGQPVKTRNFTLNLSGNVSYNRNKLLSLSNDHYQRDYMVVGSTGAPIQQATHIVREGGEIGDFYGRKSIGIAESGEWILEGDERQVIGNGIPKLNAALSLTMAYRGLDLSISFRGAFIYQILNQYRMIWETWQRGQQYNYPVSILEKPYGGEYGIKATTTPAYVSYYVEDGDFVKFDNLTFGYNFKFRRRCPVKTLRLYLAGRNLCTFTKYKGIDPEVSFLGLSPGIDYLSSYPTTRTFTFGVKLGF